MATKTIPQLPSAAPLSGPELFESTQVSGGPTVSVKVTATQLKDFILGTSEELIWTIDASNNMLGGAGAGASITTGANNLFAGPDAGNDVTGAFWNVAIGEQSLWKNQTGSQNVCVGFQAGYGVNFQSCAANTFIGYTAGRGIRTGQGNTAVGSNALDKITTGSNNTAIGRLAGEVGTTVTGDENTFVGYRAGQSITSGQYNVAIGAYAGYGGLFSGGGSRNVCIGYEAGRNEPSDSDRLFIGNNATENLIEGDFAKREVNINGSLGLDIGVSADTISNASSASGIGELMTASAIQTAIVNSKFTGTTVAPTASLSASAIDGQVFLVDATSANTTILLTYSANSQIIVKRTDGSANTVTIKADDGKTIDGQASITVPTQYQSFTLFGFNNVWSII